MINTELISPEMQAKLEYLRTLRQAELAEELAAQAELAAQRAEIIKSIDPKIFRKEAQEVYANYLASGIFDRPLKYVITSNYIENCDVDVEIQDGRLSLGYFNHQVRISYWPGIDQEQQLKALELAALNNDQAPELRFSMVKPLLTFGYNAFLVTASAGTTYEFDLDDKGAYAPGIYYYLSGRGQITVKSTGEKLLERTAGWLSTEHTDYSSTGNEKAINYFPEESKWICIPHRINKNGLPNVSKLIIRAGTTETIPNGSNILICEGELVSNNITYPVPSRLRPRQGDISVSAITDVYALIFN